MHRATTSYILLAGLAVLILQSVALSQPSPIAPDQATQQLLDQAGRVVGQARSEERAREFASQLYRIEEISRHREDGFLGAQLVHYVARADEDLKNVWPFVVQIYRLIPNARLSFIAGAIPLLDGENESTRHAAEFLLTLTATANGDECIDFVGIAPFAVTSDAVARWMYDLDPGKAMIAIDASSPDFDPVRHRLLLITEHEVADASWREQRGFPVQRDAVTTGLQSIAQRPEWYARLFVAEAIRRDPKLSSPRLLAVLHNDDHPLVRRALGEEGADRVPDRRQ
jgi:hypothetical protein